MSKFTFKLDLLIVLMLFTLGCKENNSRKAEFNSFLKKFKPLNLPIKIKGCTIAGTFLTLSQKELPSYADELEQSYCLVNSNTDYIAVFTFGTAECYVPTLSTYDLKGNRIDRKQIFIGGCGSDCGYYCEEFMILDSDYTIYVSDTVISYECDRLGNPISGTQENYVNYKKGKLLSTGKIELSDEIKLSLMK